MSAGAWFSSANYTGRDRPFPLRIRKKNTGLQPIDPPRRRTRQWGVTLYHDARAALGPGGHDIRIEQALEIVQAYGDALESSPPRPGVVADTAALPDPKDTIKWALLIVLGASAEAPRRERLKAAFIALSEFQTHADYAQGFDSTRLRKRIDPLALAKEFAAQRTPEDRWNAAARAEQAALVDELRRRGFW